MIQAKAGGEKGINGEWYEGGQFLPEHEDTVKGMQKIIIHKGDKKEIAPYTWEKAPADNMLPIWWRVGFFCCDNRKECEYVKGIGFSGLKVTPLENETDSYGRPMSKEWNDFIAHLAELFNQGVRWYPLSDDPFHYLNQK